MSTQGGMREPVKVGPILGAIILAVGASVGAFAMTWSFLIALGVYMFTACLVYAVLWVVGYA